LQGSFPVHDLGDLGVQFSDAPRGDYTTIAGLVLLALSRIPKAVGERVEMKDWIIEVNGVSRNAVTEVRLIPRTVGADRA
jgi:putative hemolysin